MKMEGRTVQDPKQENQKEKMNAEIIVLISDDDDDVVDVAMEKKLMKMEITATGDSAQGIKTEVKAEAEADIHDVLLSIIRVYCSDSMGSSTDTDTSGSLVSAILRPSYQKDITKASLYMPYCLYLYMGVELGGGQTTSLVLIGYFDVSSGVSAVKLLQALQLSVDKVEPQTLADMDADTVPAESDAHLLIETLTKSGLDLSNLAVFYCNAPQPAVSQVFVSKLQTHNPRLVSLCSLPGMAGRALQAGLLASFKCVVDLVRDVHRHYSTHPTVNESLKEIFADAESYNPSHPISSQCLFIICTVQKMVSRWRDLVEYFKSQGQTEAAVRIRAQMMDYKVKLQFIFLSQILEPLRALEELQQCGTADVATELRQASILLEHYAGSILQPSVAARFLRQPDLLLLHTQRELLPVAEVNVGSHARDFLWATAVVDLGEQERRDFLKDVVAFYRAALQSLVNSAPEQLGDAALRNIITVLKNPQNLDVRTFVSLIET